MSEQSTNTPPPMATASENRFQRWNRASLTLALCGTVLVSMIVLAGFSFWRRGTPSSADPAIMDAPRETAQKTPEVSDNRIHPELTDEKIFSSGGRSVLIAGYFCDLWDGVVVVGEDHAAPFLERDKQGIYRYRSLAFSPDLAVGTVGVIRPSEGLKSFPGSPYPAKPYKLHFLKKICDDSVLIAIKSESMSTIARFDRFGIAESANNQEISLEGKTVIAAAKSTFVWPSGETEEMLRFLPVTLPEVPPSVQR